MKSGTDSIGIHKFIIFLIGVNNFFKVKVNYFFDLWHFIEVFSFSTSRCRSNGPLFDFIDIAAFEVAGVSLRVKFYEVMIGFVDCPFPTNQVICR